MFGTLKNNQVFQLLLATHSSWRARLQSLPRATLSQAWVTIMPPCSPCPQSVLQRPTAPGASPCCCSGFWNLKIKKKKKLSLRSPLRSTFHWTTNTTCLLLPILNNKEEPGRTFCPGARAMSSQTWSLFCTASLTDARALH